MRCRNLVVDHHRAQALKTVQAVLQRTLSTPAKVNALCAEELEDLQDREVEVRHCLSLAPRRGQLRLRRLQDRRMKAGRNPLVVVPASSYLQEQSSEQENASMDQEITYNEDGSITIIATMVSATDSDLHQLPTACGLQLVDEEEEASATSASS